MKIKITYTEKEEQTADLITAFVRNLLRAVKIRRSEKHKPFLHIYISSRGEE